jgi:membrane associated rhomboid family serine protease
MIPLRDNIPSSRPPYLNYSLIAVNALAFFLELSTGPHLQNFIQAFGFVPGRFVSLLGHLPQALPVMFIPLVTSIFLHGGWLHLIGNMWFLYIFGDNVEDILGHGRYLLLYLVSGVGANLIYLIFSPFSLMPLVGASGAVAGVMGAYFFLFPGARVLTLVPIFFFITVLELPAYIFLGFWFLMQFLFGAFSGVGPQAGTGGVAWWAHVGGFLLGILLLYPLSPVRVMNPFRRQERI